MIRCLGTVPTSFSGWGPADFASMPIRPLLDPMTSTVSTTVDSLRIGDSVIESCSSQMIVELKRLIVATVVIASAVCWLALLLSSCCW
jgi:hypothetical protein